MHIVSKQLDSMLALDLRNVEVPLASVYVVDAHAAREATGALFGNILDHFPTARLLVVGEKLKEAESQTLLRQGVGHPELRRGSRAAPSGAAVGCERRLLGPSRDAFALRGFDFAYRARASAPGRFRPAEPTRTGRPQRAAQEPGQQRSCRSPAHFRADGEVPRFESPHEVRRPPTRGIDLALLPIWAIMAGTLRQASIRRRWCKGGAFNLSADK
jgi:hypothetical protein